MTLDHAADRGTYSVWHRVKMKTLLDSVNAAAVVDYISNVDRDLVREHYGLEWYPQYSDDNAEPGAVMFGQSILDLCDSARMG